MEVEEETPRCHRCGKPARCYEIGVDDACAYCGLVCQTAERLLVRNTPQDCTAKLRRFRPVRILGEGCVGLVFVFVSGSSSDNEGALKVTRTVCENEILVHCILTGMPGFVRLLDYWICDELPQSLPLPIDPGTKTRDWFGSEYRRQPLIPKTYTFMAMEKAMGTIGDLQADEILSLNEQWQFCFEMLHSYNEAKVTLGFIHNDINYVNILYIASVPRFYTLGDGSQLICNSPFRPLWADFETATLNNKKTSKRDFRGLWIQMSNWPLLPSAEVNKIAGAHEFATNYDAWLLQLAEKIQRSAPVNDDY